MTIAWRVCFVLALVSCTTTTTGPTVGEGGSPVVVVGVGGGGSSVEDVGEGGSPISGGWGPGCDWCAGPGCETGDQICQDIESETRWMVCRDIDSEPITGLCFPTLDGDGRHVLCCFRLPGSE